VQAAEKNRNIFWRFFKWVGLLLAGLFLLLSILPYLIPQESNAITRQELAFPNSVFDQVRDVEMHYRIWDSINEREKNILLVHGFGASTFSWRYTAFTLQEEGFRVFAVDLPGFGLSERKRGLDHSPEARAEILWVMLEELYPDQQWNLVGHSMGGGTVAAMALQKPEQTESLTLVAGALFPGEPSFFNYILKYPPAGQWVRVVSSRFLLDESRIEQFLASAYGQQPTPQEISGYYLPLTVENTDAVLVDLLRTVSESLIGRIDQLKLPVLIIWGSEDAWVPVQQGRKLDRLLPRSELIVMPGEGHCPMETAPDLFNRKLLDFIDRKDMEQ